MSSRKSTEEDLLDGSEESGQQRAILTKVRNYQNPFQFIKRTLRLINDSILHVEIIKRIVEIIACRNCG